MINRIGSPAAAGFTADRRPQQKAGKAKSREAIDTTADPAATAGEALRLVIEQEDGVYVYKLVDRETGKVIASVPRSEIGKLADSPEYASGFIVSTTA